MAENDSAKRQAIETLLSEFNYLVACSYSRLEFKRVVIQNLALALRYICEEKSFFAALHRANRLRRSRRAGTLINVLAWLGYDLRHQIEIRLGDDLDTKLAQQAESLIRNAIRYVWKRFDKSVDSVLNGTECVRATEGPRLLPNGTLDVAIPEGRCRQKECNNANFLRSNLPTIRRLCTALEHLRESNGNMTAELETALTTLRAIENALERAYDYKTCLAIGDVWIHLEAACGRTENFATTNYRESQVLCPIFGLALRTPASTQD